MVDQKALKRRVAAAALEHIEQDRILGMGTGSTVNALLDLVEERGIPLRAAVSSSEATSQRLTEIGVPLIDLNEAGTLDLYIDGADEVDPAGNLIKGGGAALTREKIIAAASRRFVCIVDASKSVAVLGAFPLPVEVIPMARSLVARQLVGLGGRPEYREGVITDNGNVILDVHNLDLTDPVATELEINQWPGVVTVGLFARRKADTVLVGSTDGVEVRQIR